MLKSSYPYYLASEAVAANEDLEVTDKYTGEVATVVAMADPVAIDQGIAAAAAAAEPMRKMRPYERQQILSHCVTRFQQRFDELAMSLCVEAGKPIKDSRGEVSRLIDTFRIAAEESVRMSGEVMNLEISARARGYRGMFRRVPIGPCSFISPFNFPLNLAAHKVAPALAVGCPFVLKPASRTPIGALVIGEVLAETDLPEGAFSILPCSRDGADLFTTDDRLKLLSFTGSPAVGWKLKSMAGKKTVVLELGGNAACVVDEDADLDDATCRLIIGAFYQSGQSCIGVQRIIAHKKIYASTARPVGRGHPRIGGGRPEGRSDVHRSDDFGERSDSLGELGQACGRRGWQTALRWTSVMERCCRRPCWKTSPPIKTFARKKRSGRSPCWQRSADFDDAIDQVNDSVFGLQAGIFTRDLYKMQQAWDELDVGGVVIGDVPSWRVDNMPYGGVKDSGLGREGVRFAMEDMTEIRNLVIRTPLSSIRRRGRRGGGRSRVVRPSR